MDLNLNFWDPPDHLQEENVVTPTNETAEEVLEDTYNWDEESADEAIPDNFFESITQSGEGWSMAAGDAAEYVDNNLLPDWLPLAIAGLLVVVLLVVLRPYASIASGVAS